MPKSKTETKPKYYYAVGRRKRSSARIRLYPGKGETIVNSQPIEEYFKSVLKPFWWKPFEITQTEGKFYVTAKIEGGGVKSQAEAFAHGVSRALVKVDEKYKPLLKQAGLLTRDPREKERRKYGYAQKARAKKQSPKR